MNDISVVTGRPSDSAHTVRINQIEKLRYTREKAAEALGMSVRNIDYRIQMGAIETKRDGRRVYITAAELRRYANRDHLGRVQ